jgi:HSP20 family protein
MGDFDELVNGFISPSQANLTSNGTLMPAMDIVESNDSYIVKTDLPGIKKEDLQISVKDKLLTIEAESSEEKTEKEGEKIIKIERRSGKYCRSLRLGNSVDESKIAAQISDGVLTLTLPKAQEATSRQIEIKAD